MTLDKVLKKKRKSLGRPSLGMSFFILFIFLSSSPMTAIVRVYLNDLQNLGHAESATPPGPAVKQASTSNKQTTPTKSRSSRTPQVVTSSDVKELCKELYNSVKDYTVSSLILKVPC